MENMSVFFFLLSILLCLTFQPHLIMAYNYPVVYPPPPKGSPSEAEGLLVTACGRALHKDYCINLLKSDRNYNNTNLKGLAYIALKIAEKNATETSTFIQKELESTDLQPEQQQGLSDCSEHYIAAVELIDDAINALVSNAHNEVTKLVKAAVADFDGCSANIQDEDHVVARKNHEVRQIANTALSVAHVGVH